MLISEGGEVVLKHPPHETVNIVLRDGAEAVHDYLILTDTPTDPGM